MTTINDQATLILTKRSEVRQDKSLLVAVSGIDGSGKGYITEKIVAEVNNRGVYAIAINIDASLTPPQTRFNPKNPIECSFETALERALKRNQEDLPQELIVHDYHTIYFPAQRFHFAVDEPKSSVDAIYVNDS